MAKQQEQEQSVIPQSVTFFSRSPRLRISFRKPRGRAQDGKPIPFPDLQFKSGRAVIDQEKYDYWEPGEFETYFELIQKHPGNRANGGREFWMESANDRDAMDLAAGKIVAHPPFGGMTPQIDKILSTLYSASKTFSPAEQPKVYSKLCEMMDLFSVKGLALPDESYNPRRLRARIIEFLGVLEDLNIWSKEDDDGSKG